LAIVKPETVVRWHRAGFRSYWRWKSRARGCLLLSYMNYYNEVRTHLSLEKDSPVSRNVQRAGHILFLCRPVLAGCITYIFGFDLRQARSCGDRAPISWHTKSIAKLSGSQLPKHDPQIEAVCADGGERVLLLQETPPRVELIDTKALQAIASIDLVVEGRDEIARAWSDPNGSRGEGMVQPVPIVNLIGLVVDRESDDAVVG
jgi:hypothetical protein